MLKQCNCQKCGKIESVTKLSPNSCLLFQKLRLSFIPLRTKRRHLSGMQSKYRSKDAHSTSQSGKPLGLSKTLGSRALATAKGTTIKRDPSQPRDSWTLSVLSATYPRVSRSPRLMPLAARLLPHPVSCPSSQCYIRGPVL